VGFRPPPGRTLAARGDEPPRRHRGDGQPAAVVVARDVTDRLRAEERFRILADHSPVGIYIVQDGAFQYVNPRFERITGYAEEDLVGRNPLWLVHQDDRERVHDFAIEMLKGERAADYEYRIVNRPARSAGSSKARSMNTTAAARPQQLHGCHGTQTAEEEQEKLLRDLANSNEG
jgi:PAS domain S-box-containing protein